MNSFHNDADLRGLLHEAVDDVVPTERLAEIRERTQHSHSSRRGWYAVGAAGLAAAAAVTAVAVITSDDTSAPPQNNVATHTTEPELEPVTVFYAGPGGTGPDAKPAALYPYVEQATSPAAALMQEPTDPDYRTLWPEGSIVSVGTPEDHVVPVEIADVEPTTMAEQQVVYTLRAAFDDADLAVRFLHDDVAADPVTALPELEVLSHLIIREPAEGAHVSGSLTVTGDSNGFEASVACRLNVENRDWDAGMAEGWMDARLFPFSLEMDLTGVAPGTYELTCTTDDATGGAEGIGAFVDTRTIVVD